MGEYVKKKVNKEASTTKKGNYKFSQKKKK